MTSLRKLLKVLALVIAGALALVPSPLLACAACTGRTDSALAHGMNWGILTLLGFILSVLTCLAVFFVHVARRSAAADDEETPLLPG